MREIDSLPQKDPERVKQRGDDSVFLCEHRIGTREVDVLKFEHTALGLADACNRQGETDSTESATKRRFGLSAYSRSPRLSRRSDSCARSARGTAAVAVRHRGRLPPGEIHQITFGSTFGAELVRQRVPEAVRMDRFDPGLFAAAAEELRDTGLGERTLRRKPHRGQLRLRMCLARPHVARERLCGARRPLVPTRVAGLPPQRRGGPARRSKSSTVRFNNSPSRAPVSNRMRMIALSRRSTKSVPLHVASRRAHVVELDHRYRAFGASLGRVGAVERIRSPGTPWPTNRRTAAGSRTGYGGSTARSIARRGRLSPGSALRIGRPLRSAGALSR